MLGLDHFLENETAYAVISKATKNPLSAL